MSKMRREIQLTSYIPQIVGHLEGLADAVDRKTAFDVLAEYQSRARRDTGAQVNSAYVATSNDSTYAQAIAAAREANPDLQHFLSEIQPSDGYTYVAVAVEYAAVNEFGGHGRIGDGALTNAVESQRAAFEAARARLLEMAAKESL